MQGTASSALLSPKSAVRGLLYGLGIALAYGIGRDFVSITDDGEREVIRIYLSQPKP